MSYPPHRDSLGLIQLAGRQAKAVFDLNEARGEAEVLALSLGWKREEVAGDLPRARRSTARALPPLGPESVKAIVNRDLLASPNSAPRKDLNAAAHGVRLARVVQVATRRKENRAPIVVELAEVPAILT